MRSLPDDAQQKVRALALKEGTTVAAIVKTALLDVATRVTAPAKTAAKTTTLIAAGA